MPLLALLAIAGAAGIVFAGLEPPSSRLPPTATTAPPVEGAERSAAFLPWPDFVLVWEVTGWPRWTRRNDPAAQRLPAGPCASLDTPTCYVRLAWGGEDRWSLTYSEDVDFTADDTMELTWADRHFVRFGATLFRGAPAGSDIPLEACRRLQEASEQGQPVTASLWNEQAGHARGVVTLSLVGPDGETARCLRPWGIPVAVSQEGYAWRWTSIRFSFPNREELAGDLIPRSVLDDPAG